MSKPQPFRKSRVKCRKSEEGLTRQVTLHRGVMRNLDRVTQYSTLDHTEGIPQSKEI